MDWDECLQPWGQGVRGRKARSFLPVCPSMDGQMPGFCLLWAINKGACGNGLLATINKASQCKGQELPGVSSLAGRHRGAGRQPEVSR